MSQLSNAEIVIVGGGAVGLGVAYALAKAGHSDILLLERAEGVGRVTTSQGAGLCGQVRDSAERIKLAMHSVTVFRELQKTGVKPDWQEVGSIRLALNDRRVAEFQQLKQAADAAGLEAELIDNAEAKRLWPMMEFDRVKAVLWCPSDGCMTPTAVAESYAYNCRKLGVRIESGTVVEEIVMRDGRVTGVDTNRGSVECRYVINAAGAHAYHVAKLAGLELPIVPVRHEYFITVPMEGLNPSLPCFRIPEMTLYGRVRDGGLLLGGWEPRSLHTDPRAFSLEATPPAIEPDRPVLDWFEDNFSALLPGSIGKERNFIGKGWPTFTPDGKFIIGESDRVLGFVMAGGCNAHGISGSGGIGKLLVESMFDPQPSEYVKSLSPNRFGRMNGSWEKVCKEAAGIYETYYGTES